MRTVVAVALACLLLVICGAALAQTNDVPRDHWAYQAVQDLANKGYVTGSPIANFLGERTLSRYEFATIIKRMLDTVDVRAFDQHPTPALANVSQDDLDKLYRLADEFKVELIVIGTKVQKTTPSSVPDATDKRLSNLETIVTDPEGPVEATKADVAKLKKITVGGYVQSRFEQFPGGVDEDGKATTDSFNVRRARIKVTGKPTDNLTTVVQLDAGQNKLAVKDAYADYAFKGSPDIGLDIAAGQMNWPFGYEVPYSSSRRETPERALWSRRFFTGERDRGIKVSYPINRRMLGQIGLFDGTGTDTFNTVSTFVTDSTTTPVKTGKIKVPSTVGKDYDNNKDIVANLQYNGESADFGLSAYIGKGIWNPDRAALIAVPKTRFGADFRYYLNNMTLKTEFVIARGVDEAVAGYDNSKWLTAYDAQLGYNVTAADTLVAKYESLSQDPKFPAFGRRSAWNLGVLHWLDSNTRVKLFYNINQEQSAPIDNNIWRFEVLTTY